jgi:hypothetical protein
MAAATVAVSLAFTPCAAFASSAPTAPAVKHALVSPAASSSSLVKKVSPEFKTFSSKSAGGRNTAPAAKAATSKPHTSTSGTTIYVAPVGSSCLTDPGAGTYSNPFCSIQDAVNAAKPGDTISVADPGAFPYEGDPVVIRTSDISIVGAGAQVFAEANDGGTNSPSFVLDGVSDVTISNMFLEGLGGNSTVSSRTT